MFLKRVAVSLLLLAALAAIPSGYGVDKVDPDPRAVKLINAFMEALKSADADARLAAVIPLVHKSLLSNDGRDLAPNIKQFSYRKAVQSASLYPVPVVISEVHRGNVLTIGFQATAERGRNDKYFVGKSSGRPAPIHVFFPEGGGELKITNFGSL